MIKDLQLNIKTKSRANVICSCLLVYGTYIFQQGTDRQEYSIRYIVVLVLSQLTKPHDFVNIKK